jgi:hypothetical protein
MEVSEVRRRIRGAIEEAKHRAADRRALADEAARVWEERLAEAVEPAFQAVQSALSGEGFRFSVSTPAGTARLALERSPAEYIEMALDTERDIPAVLVRSTRGRGRRIISAERIVAESPDIPDISQKAVVEILVEELIPFVER